MGPRRRIVRLVASTLAILGAVGASAGVAGAEDPLLVQWSAVAPSLTTTYDPTSENLCTKGHVACVDAVVREMTRRFDGLAAKCGHDAIFSLAYLRTTEEYRRSIEDPTFFSDTNFVNHEDAVFADYYFRAYDAWHKGDVASTPPAWRTAFDAAAKRKVTGTGNMFLGMSAHINRDLPFVLASIGLVAPDGTSRKADHDKVNVFLNRVGATLIPELARRFDPTMDDGSVAGTTLDDSATIQMIVEWREQAWRNAERLVMATTASERAAVAKSIDDAAALEATTLVASYAYPPLQSSAARDTYCAQHWSDA
jgi:hypothetical protein